MSGGYYIGQMSGSWANEQYDHSPGQAIAQSGCAMTGLAMTWNYYNQAYGLGLEQQTPLTLNETLNGIQGGFDNGKVGWNKIGDLTNKKILANSQKKSADYSLDELKDFINQDLQNNNPVIIQVQEFKNGRLSGKHWLMVTGQTKDGSGWYISDPGSTEVISYTPGTTIRKGGSGAIYTYGDIISMQDFTVNRK